MPVISIRQEAGPYLKYVKSLNFAWPHLRILSDFMETTVTPKRWEDLCKRPSTGDVSSVAHENAKIEERAKRTKVRRLDYHENNNRVTEAACDNANSLQAFLEENEEGAIFRLYVVEDLSRHVIEHFGSRFKVDPSFFRAHLVDYAWCNVRDFWRDPPSLDIASQQQSWFQLRFVIPRYFSNPVDFWRGQAEAEKFNVFRRPDDDQNRSRWDADSIVALMRTRASFWFQPPENSQAKSTHHAKVG